MSNFTNKYDPSIEDSYRTRCEIDGVPAMVDVLDTAGQEEYAAMREQYMRTGEGFILVYSITSRQSFEEIQVFQQQILRVKDKDYFPIIVVGNFCSKDQEREVSIQEGQHLAHQFACPFIEADSRQGINAEKAFHDMIREIRRYERQGNGIEPAENDAQPTSNTIRNAGRRRNLYKRLLPKIAEG